jgi:Ca2+-binding RTX toxin-like protein
MIKRNPIPPVILGLLILLIGGIATAVANANTVPATRLASRNSAINANALKPPECAALNLTAVLVCPTSGTCTGTAASELILGDTSNDTISGKGGTDCILGGAGDDTINGNAGGDVCIGGPGNDTFNKCETVIQ